MDERDLERLLGEAFAGQARQAVPDDLAVPPMPEPTRAHRRRVWLAPLASAAAVVLAVGIGVVLTNGDGDANHHPVAGSSSSTVGSSPFASAARRNYRADPGAKPVDMFFQAPGDPASGPVGVGAPLLVRFTARITDARAVQARTTVRADGRTVDAQWYFMTSTLKQGALPVVGMLRPQHYWPAHSVISVTVQAKGLTAGPGLRIKDDAAITFQTGAADIVTVDSQKHVLTLTVDGQTFGTYPVSVGASQTPTQRGIKVITERGTPICQTGPGFHQCGIKFTQRVTQSGEYLLAAPWNTKNIGKANTSNGCVDLRLQDAATLYKVLRVGDVVSFPDASGPMVGVSDNGWWNVPWAQWKTGGLVPTH